MIFSANPSVTILILNWNGRELLPQTLPALDNLDYDRYRVVVADNGSTDDSIEYIETNFPEMSIINLDENLGFSKGLNEAVRRLPLDAEILILLNNDVTVRRDWLRHLVAPFTDPQVGITGGKLLYPDEKRIQHAGAELIYPTAYSHHFHYQEIDQGQANERRTVSYVTGASLAIRRSLVEKSALFDEQFSPFYFEEVDLCYRVRNAGFDVLYVPEAVAIHHEGFSIERSSVPGQWMFHRNRLRFVLKHSTGDQFIEDFVPAEIARLQETLTSVNDLIILRQAYLDTLLSLPQTIRARKQEELYPEFQTAVDRLLQAALSKDPAISPSVSDNPFQEELGKRQHISEPEFKSEVVLLGPAIAFFRQSWNDVSTKWYVRAIIQQQQAFNELVTRLLVEQELQLKAVTGDITTLADEIVTLKRQVETLIELNGMQEPSETAVQNTSEIAGSNSEESTLSN
jgi:GT2 family glycosyltransferase